MGDEKQFSYFPEKKGQKSRFWRRKIRDREEYSITMQHAVTAHNEKTLYSNIRNYLFEFRTEIFHFAKSRFCQHSAHKYRHIGRANCSFAVRPMLNIWCLSNGELNFHFPEKGKVGKLMGKSFGFWVEWRKEKSPKWYIRLRISVKV